MFLKMRRQVPLLVRCMTGECAEIREMAAMIVRDYLTGPWKKVTPNNIMIQRISGGLSNWLYKITLPHTEAVDPKTVLLRFHGQVLSETAFEHIIMESVIFTLLSERKLGPKLHGIFPGGRIEEFIQSRPLLTSELSDPKLSLLIASKMAQIHGLHVPISKKDKCMFDTMVKWLEKTEVQLHQFDPQDLKTQKYLQKFKKYNLHTEIAWLRQFLPTINSPIVFCHNDLQEGNILMTSDSSSKTPSIILIDFEYCSYNYRGFDLANHFLEYTINYTKRDYPMFEVDPSSYPSLAHQVRFIRQYLLVQESLQRQNSTHSLDNNYSFENLGSSDGGKLDITDKENQLLKEASYFRLASHMWWGVWSAMRSQSTIEFGYWEYCIARLDAYFETKKELLSFDVPGSKRKKP